MNSTRRQFLASSLGATAAGAAAAGGTRAARASDRPADSAWSTYGADAANTGFHPDTTGPEADVGPAWEVDTGGQISAAPAVVDGTVYVGSRDDTLYALSAASGDEEWRFETAGDVRSSPAVVDGVAYVGSDDGRVYAVEEGEELWRFGTGDAVRSSPTVVDDVVYVGSQDDAVYAIDADGGTERWSFETEFWVESSPAVVDGVVYVGSDDGRVYAIEEGDPLWEFPTEDRVPGSPAVVDGVVYVGSQDRRVYALDADDGGLRWEFDTGGSVTSSPAVADGVVYVGSRSHDVYAIDAEDGEELWRFDTGRQVTVSPAVADGVVYVGSESHGVFGLDADEGDPLWEFDAGRPVTAAPAVADGTVYTGTEGGTVYALAEGYAPATDAAGATDDPDGGTAPGEPGGLPSFRFLLLPATAVGFGVLVVGGYFLLHRLGAFEPIPTASETFGTDEDDDRGDHEPALDDPGDGPIPAATPQPSESKGAPTRGAKTGTPERSELWELIIADVTARAGETETTAVEDVVVTKHLDRDTLSAPVLVYEIRSVREEPARVRLTEPLVGEGSRPLGDGWTLEGGELRYEADIEPGGTVTTLVGRTDCPSGRADELLEKPAVDVEPL